MMRTEGTGQEGVSEWSRLRGSQAWMRLGRAVVRMHVAASWEDEVGST